MKFYVHFESENGSTWTKRLTFSPESTTLRTIVDCFLAAYNKKFPHQQLFQSDVDVYAEYHQDVTTRRKIIDLEKPRILTETQEGSNICDFELIVVLNNKKQHHPSLNPCSKATKLVVTTPLSTNVGATSTLHKQQQQSERDNDHLRYLLDLGNSQMQQQNFRAAREIYRSLVLTIDSENPEALVALGNIHMHNSEYELAMRNCCLPCWKTHSRRTSSHNGKAEMVAVFQSGLIVAKCQLKLCHSQAALEILEELRAFLLQNFIDVKDKEQLQTEIDVLKVQILYETNVLENQEHAIALLTRLVPDLSHPQVNLDALLLYAHIANDRGKEYEALSMMLRVLVGKSNDKAVKQQLVQFLQHKDGIKRLQTAVPATSSSSAAAYAFLATILKDFGALQECIACFELAVKVQPSSVSYALNFAHALEVDNQYERAYDVLMTFFRDNPSLSVPAGKQHILTAGDLAQVLEHSGWTVNGEHRETIGQVEWSSEHGGYAVVTFNGAKSALRLEHLPISEISTLSDQELDLLACFFTVAKILFVNGRLLVLPRLIHLIEPVRVGRELHRTTIRNEHAYYSCIAQLLSIREGLQQAPTVSPLALSSEETTSTNACIHVCGDSHTLATAWREISMNNERVLLRPALVTGLKHWHLRKESSFYPKINFWRVLDSIPRGSLVIFLFGEIDCREGILRAVEKCKYETIEEGMAHTISIFMETLATVIDKYGFHAYIHPVVPVLNETRQLVIQYNKIFRQQVSKSNLCTWLDFFDEMVHGNPEKLHPAYELDGTHLHPSYLFLLERALNRTRG